MATLSLDGPPDVKELTCASCGVTHRRIQYLILRDGGAHAVSFVSLHDHDEQPEAWFDVILGSWQAADAPGHVTFGCRYGRFEGQDDPACSLVAAAEPFDDKPFFGWKLTRDEALVHPRLQEFWDVVDFLILTQHDIHDHVD